MIKRKALHTWAVPILLCLWGLATCFWPSLHSGFELLPGDLSDGRLNHYFLEHGWRWISGNPLHASFWDAPFFYPYNNVMAWSDILLGCAPFYWAARALDMDVFNAYLFFALCLGVANFFSMFLFLRRAMRLATLSSALGGFLFAFCAARMQVLGHIQMWPHYYSVLLLWCVTAAYRHALTHSRRSRVFMLGATCCFVLQLYAGFYLGWFLALGIGVFLISGLLFAETRNSIKELLLRHGLWLLLCLMLAFLLLFPMAQHYLEAQKFFGGRPFWAILPYMPDVSYWLNNPALLYQKLQLTSPKSEMYGLGIVTLLLCLCGLNMLKRRTPWGRCLFVSLVIVFALSFNVYRGVLWEQLVFSWVPGASAVRAVSRIFFLALLVLPIGLAFMVENKRFLIKALCVMACLAESFHVGHFFYERGRTETASAAIAVEAVKHQGPFIFVPTGNAHTGMDAMWAALLADRPTINGYSGWEPPEYREITLENTPPYLAGLQGAFLRIFRSADGTMTSRLEENVDMAGVATQHANIQTWSPDSTTKMPQQVKLIDFTKIIPEHTLGLEGFSYPETKFNWTVGRQAIIHLAAPISGTGRLQFHINMVYGDNARLPFILRLGKHAWPLHFGATKRIVEIRYALEDTAHSIILDIPRPQSPQESGTSNDSRRLGAAIEKLLIIPDD